jgi:hypothetical protein
VIGQAVRSVIEDDGVSGGRLRIWQSVILIYFRVIFSAPHLYLTFEDRPVVEFTFSDLPTTIIRITEAPRDPNFIQAAARCEALCQREASTKIQAMFHSVAEGTMPEGGKLTAARSIGYVNPDGKINPR